MKRVAKIIFYYCVSIIFYSQSCNDFLNPKKVIQKLENVSLVFPQFDDRSQEYQLHLKTRIDQICEKLRQENNLPNNTSIVFKHYGRWLRDTEKLKDVFALKSMACILTVVFAPKPQNLLLPTTIDTTTE